MIYCFIMEATPYKEIELLRMERGWGVEHHNRTSKVNKNYFQYRRKWHLHPDLFATNTYTTNQVIQGLS